MDADRLRLILLALGLLLVAGIYLWDRFSRRRRPHARQAPTERRAPRLEPDSDADDPDLSEVVAAREASLEPVQLQGWQAIELDGEPAVDEGLSFDALGASDYLHTSTEDGTPRLIVQLNVVGRGLPFSGEAVSRAAREVGLIAGEMAIYHRYDPQRTDQVLFSMASMVEPGSFPLDRMADFTTPGLTLFTQLPGVRDGLYIYSDMLFSAERLAAILHGELQDEHHHALTKQWIEHTRERVLEHRRQVQLARKRA